MPFSQERATRSMPREGHFALVAMSLAILPVILLLTLWGYSCGHDLPFHLGSWQDAAQQLGHGGWPRWDYMAARSAGEPRFVFYPPISWLVGAALRSLLSPEHAAVGFVLLALACCWCTMYAAARRITTAAGAAIAGTVYALGPYTLFNALERSADAELLAMAWLPLLFVAVMRERPRVAGIALPMALLWLTNVPTAIIGSYLVLLLGALRLLRDRRAQSMRRFAAVAAIGVGLGIGLAGFFLVPAVHQQADVQISAAFSEGQSYGDNFLLRHSEHTRRGLIHEISLLTLEEMSALIVVLGLLAMRIRRSIRRSWADDERRLAATLGVIAGVVLFLMLPWSGLLWEHLPKLSVLQFPWRLLCVLSMLLAFAAGLLLRPLRQHQTLAAGGVLLLAALLGWSGFRHFWLDPLGHEDNGASRAEVLPVVERRATVEYTPIGDENDTLRDSPPGFWLQARSTGLAGGAGHGDVVEQALPQARAGSDAAAPAHLELELAQAEVLVLDLRAYPQWHVLRNGVSAPLLPRADGLIAVALPAGGSVVDVVWVNGWDRVVGWVVSMVALGLLALSSRRRSARPAS